ncbi:MAG: hypothetical protein WA414_11440, partial [Acidobacteriaceae bacterium]
MRFSLDSSSVSRFVQFPRSGQQALLATAGLFLAVPLVFGQTAPIPAASAKAAPAGSVQTASSPSPKGAHEGITVHGYWKIDVHNKDGSLAKHVEFENSLISPYGAPTLATLLQGGVTSLGTSILITGGVISLEPAFGVQDNGGVYSFKLLPGPCGTSGGVGTDCILSSATDPVYNNCVYLAQTQFQNYTSAACVSNLSASQSTSGALTLSGSFIAGETSQ